MRKLGLRASEVLLDIVCSFWFSCMNFNVKFRYILCLLQVASQLVTRSKVDLADAKIKYKVVITTN